ncbi:hypothetical protein RJ639_017095 [Escallonia herrerae]|uniref:DUF4371 domain-containing protein n=1 Tax=Escallonia herrerae TaxID=1293975 RepID=A0AA88VDX8_9ASTE|nr:hypothetical protein RJ639_017095 [Escallonia herrerae]
MYNRGNFMELVKRFARYNANVAEVVLDKAPLNASYTSPIIHKQILHVVSKKARRAIPEEIGDAKFRILVDEARDDN